ncbi:MAG: hypothetical protein HFG40_02580 [Bacilli bacterium]|nr:hypothetical protein [Bacilli bacterium]
MKRFVLEKSLGMVRNYYPEYDSDTMDRISYGLESIYLSITKAVVIFSLAYIFKILKESVFLCFCFNILRFSGFGLHASKSWMCWISSILLFLVIPYLCQSIIIDRSILIGIALVCELNLLLFAPADTKKRPLIHKKRRIIWKLITAINGMIFVCIISKTNNSLVQNIFLSAMLIECFLVNPIIYKIFHMPYNNYKSYVYSAYKK